jgi:hypothetical protein
MQLNHGAARKLRLRPLDLDLVVALGMRESGRGADEKENRKKAFQAVSWMDRVGTGQRSM